MDYKNNKILILGASGLIGSYLYDLFNKKGFSVIGTYCNTPKKDLIHFNMVNSDLNELPLENVNFCIICSAITKLDICKENPDYSKKVNVEKMTEIIKKLSERNIIPIYFSSASVFDGIEGNYKEDDIEKRNATNLYGKQKVEVENFIFSNIGNYLIIRPGKVFGIKKNEGVLFTHWLEQYQRGEEIRLANDEKLSPTYALDVARAILFLIEKNARGIWHVNPNFYLSRYQMAMKFFNHSNLQDAKLISCSIDDFGLLEKRPKNTYMNANKLINLGFEFTSLEDCFEEIKKNYL